MVLARDDAIYTCTSERRGACYLAECMHDPLLVGGLLTPALSSKAEDIGNFVQELSDTNLTAVLPQRNEPVSDRTELLSPAFLRQVQWT